METTLSPHDIHRLLNADYDDPFSVLGIHECEGDWVVRAFRPDAKSLTVIDRSEPSRRFSGNRIAREGWFEATLTGAASAFDYLLEVVAWSGETLHFSDPYSYGPILGELDTYLIKEGKHYDIYKKLGAQLTEINGHAGATFAVWAPNARRVSIVGDFNGWDGRCHPMRKRIEAGIWEIFIPGITEGTLYKLEL